MNLKVDETRKTEASQDEDLERMLQKLEGDVRQHIRVEQQLKLHIESVQEKLEEEEKKSKDVDRAKHRHQREKERMDEILTLREDEIEGLKGHI